MKMLGIASVIPAIGLFSAAPAVAHECGHHNDRYGDCRDCGHYRRQGPQASRRGWEPGGGTATVQTFEGKIAEIVYLPGAAADSGMVEIRLQTAAQTTLIRLAPSGFLKQIGLLLREGDAVAVRGFPVSGMEGDLIIATEVRKGDRSVSLRDTRGRPAW
jgi:hypothetical protein